MGQKLTSLSCKMARSWVRAGSARPGEAQVAEKWRQGAPAPSLGLDFTALSQSDHPGSDSGRGLVPPP